MSFFARMFGRSARPAAVAEEVAPDKTKKASQVAQSGPRVETICSEQMSSGPGEGKTPGEPDTGPWFIGKTVGEIYQIPGVLGAEHNFSDLWSQVVSWRCVRPSRWSVMPTVKCFPDGPVAGRRQAPAAQPPPPHDSASVSGLTRLGRQWPR